MGTAVEELAPVIESLYPQMVAYTKRHIYHRNDAEELTGEAVARAMSFARRNPDYRATNWKHWMWRIHHNVVNDYFRGRNKEFKCSSIEEAITCKQPNLQGISVVIDTDRPGNSNLHFDPNDATQELAIDSDLVGEVHQHTVVRIVLDLINIYLTKEQRETVLMTYYLGMSRIEIGNLLFPGQEPRKAAGRVGSLLIRAKRRLREVIEDSYYATQLVDSYQ